LDSLLERISIPVTKCADYIAHPPKISDFGVWNSQIQTILIDDCVYQGILAIKIGAIGLQPHKVISRRIGLPALIRSAIEPPKAGVA
jgi:hypothetical protein